MPPSGYSIAQASAIRNFLRSCSEALEVESTQKSETLVTSLRREITDIDGYVKEETLHTTQISVLKLTQAFYTAVLSEQPCDPAMYHSAVEAALDEIVADVLAVHIEPGRFMAA